LSSIGRGYTDLCAALLAAGLDADELQVWKEVDGIFTADPRKVPTARLIPIITPEEAAELTYYGSEVRFSYNYRHCYCYYYCCCRCCHYHGSLFSSSRI